MHLSKSIERTTSRVNLNVNFGLQVIMMCQGRFISRNKYTTLVGVIDNGAAYACMRQGVLGKSYTFSILLWTSNCYKKQSIFLKLRELKEGRRIWLENGTSEFKMKNESGEYRQRWVERTWLTKLLSEFWYNMVIDWAAHPHPAISKLFLSAEWLL